MIIGIDVGGTHADGVLMNGNNLLAKKKVRVDHSRLGDSIIHLLKELVPENRKELTRIHLSSTICTNAIITDNLDDVGMFVQAGPGMNPSFLDCGNFLHHLTGAIDHRGTILKNPNMEEVQAIASQLKERGINSVGIVTKFSHRNKEHEQSINDSLKGTFTHISMGHSISGLPNFPRRVYSTWLNAALKSTFFHFKEAIEESLEELGISCPCHILKADGGTFPFLTACNFPCESIYSGPSASVMGCLALKDDAEDAILLDIGGTTTDISLLADGIPLLEPYGITVAGRPTLIRALNTKSVGLGGDSAVSFENGEYTIGPDKKGPPMALGGKIPTPTDAMIVLDKISMGSVEKAKEAMKMLRPEQDEAKTADELLHRFAHKVTEAAKLMVEEVFSRPVYTVSALLNRKKIKPKEIIVIGGPAKALEDVLVKTFELPCNVPADFEVANAIGAARTRLTIQATLYADTADGRLSIPEISCLEYVSPGYRMQDAENRLTEVIHGMAKQMGMTPSLHIDFVEKLEMNTVRGFQTSGKILSLKAQIRPGLEGSKEVIA